MRSLRSSPEATASQTQRLTDEFYCWERRGRGWQLWPYRVRLEPPFVPFRFHNVPRATAHILDDGRRPTLLSRATDRLLGFLRPPGDEPDLAELDLEDIGCEPVEPGDTIEELGVTLRAGTDVSAGGTEHFLNSFPSTEYPLGFEVIGGAESVGVQFVCPQVEAVRLDHHLRAHFPDAVFTSRTGALQSCWQAARGCFHVVDYGLSEEFMLPIHRYLRYDPDPLTAVAASLSDLEPGECGVLQVLWERTRNPWPESVLRAVLDDAGSPFFLDAPDLTKRAQEKISRPLFACIVRVGARAGSSDRATRIVQGVGSALASIASPSSNWLIPLSNDGYDDAFHEADLLERTTHRSGMLLSSAELVSLVHPPSASVRVEKLVREAKRTRAAPPNATSGASRLGMNEHGGKSVEVGLDSEQRSQHVYVIGASGTGKSTLLLNLILQDLAAGQGLALLDPHGDLVEEVLRRCPEERAEDVVLLDPADADYPIGFNVLSAKTELERTLLSSDLVAVFRRLSTSWGDQMTSVLGNAILAFLESEQGGTLVDLRRFLVEPGFRKGFLKTVRDPEVVYYWEREFPLLSGKPQAPLLTRLDAFLRPKPIRYMVAQMESRLDLREVMDQGKVLLVRLSQGAIGEENANLLGALLVAKFHQIAMSRQEVALADRRPFYLYLDEFHNFVTPSMESILSGARKYRLGLVLAHQDLQQIRSRSPEVLNSVTTNPYTRICFRVGEQDARLLAEGFAHFDARDLQGLGRGEALVRVERSEYDFNLRTRQPDMPDDESGQDVRERIRERSRSRYGRPREEIEALLGSRGASERVEPPTPPEARRLFARPLVEPSTVSPARPPHPVPRPESTEPRPTRETGANAGRGGAQHRYLQELVRQWAEAKGWRASIEESVLNDLGRVDVALRKGSRSIACEVAVTSSAEHELENARKCLAAGFECVLAVTPTARLLAALRRTAAKSLADPDRARVEFCAPDEMFHALDAIDARGSVSEQTVRGYRVKVRVAKEPAHPADSVRQTIAAVMARALRKGKGRD